MTDGAGRDGSAVASAWPGVEDVGLAYTAEFGWHRRAAMRQHLPP
ncbi:MAG TPA: hypothetical protein VFX16_20110 [Pseudonocardiaceae bacterium]|nr:hypothetical protein [Pseudonocardiaceae bacterium]